MNVLRVVDGGAHEHGMPAASVWLKHRQAAEYLQVSENKLREMRRAWADAHPGDRIERLIGERAVRFSIEDLDRLSRWWSDQLAARHA